MALFWDVIPCGLVEGYIYSGRMYPLWGLIKMKVLHSSKAVAAIPYKIAVLTFNSVSLAGSHVCQKWLWHTFSRG
jgi:hypothetical protein